MIQLCVNLQDDLGSPINCILGKKVVEACEAVAIIYEFRLVVVAICEEQLGNIHTYLSQELVLAYLVLVNKHH